MESEFWAAIAGAVVGGLVSAIIQYLSIRHQRSEEEKRRLEVRQLLGRSLTFKLMRIVRDLHGINVHLTEGGKSAPPEMQSEPWSYVQPIANLPEKVLITYEEIALISEEDVDLVNDLLDLDGIYASSMQLTKIYGELRQALAEKLPSNNFQGVRGIAELNQDQAAVLRPRMIELNTILQALFARSEADAAFAKRVLFAASCALAKKYDLKIKLGIQADGNGS